MYRISEMSLLERLMIQCDIYQRDRVDNEYDDRVITKLVRNYRSHKELLHIPNKLFYDNELMVSMVLSPVKSKRRHPRFLFFFFGVERCVSNVRRIRGYLDLVKLFVESVFTASQTLTHRILKKMKKTERN